MSIAFRMLKKWASSPKPAPVAGEFEGRASAVPATCGWSPVEPAVVP